MTYQERIRALREDADIKQEQIANMLGVAQNTYSQYELGKRSMPIDYLIVLCKYYKVSSDYVLGLKRKNAP
ncbi:MAG: helix-turn-helix domain-containing protein [Oscillospiraceae bacterium]|nr:helix-turn-helix domain-containing protein [Oscillospiraceae bacterium]